MPWNESTRMDERRLFVEAYLSDGFTMAELCRSAGNQSTDRLSVGGTISTARRGRAV